MKKILLVLLLVGIAFSFNASNYDCTETEEGTFCTQASQLSNVNATFIEDIDCYSSVKNCGANCADVMDGGCFSYISLDNDLQTDSCQTKITSTGVEYNVNCEKISLAKEEEYDIFVSPKQLGISKCQMFAGTTDELVGLLNSTAYVTTCPATGKRVTFNGLFANEGFTLISMKTSTETAISSLVVDFIIENLAYLALIAFILVAGYLVLKPPAEGRGR